MVATQASVVNKSSRFLTYGQTTPLPQESETHPYWLL